MKLAAGDALAAKQDLQRALGLAHRNLGNQQLVVQVRGYYILPPNPSIRLDLRRALGLAHQNLGNQQLVVQVRGSSP